MLNKKLKKLIRDPNLFFSDMVEKHRKKYAHVYTTKVDGHYQYSVVSAVYNVGRYLDDYFKSIVNQQLDFKKNIHLILVDDGSTDGSAEIIKKWQAKYPNNITYIWKENGGQASARNIGLEHVKTTWVTFIDPDDFIDNAYFSEIDKYMFSHKHESFCMVSCNVIFFYEKDGSYKNVHPLSFKYNNGNVSYTIENIGKNIQLYSNSVLFKTHSIINNNVKFDEDVKPNFEDGKFNADYLLGDSSGKIAFLQSAKYYYRKRDDGSSTLDTSWDKVERYTKVTKNGYLSILSKYYNKLGYVPEFIQRTVLYDIVWNVKRIVDHPERASFLTDFEKSQYFNCLLEIFTYIDEKTIMKFELAGCWFYHKIGMLGCFKGINPDFQVVYVERFDSFKYLVQLRYFTNTTNFSSIELDGIDTLPIFSKTIPHDFLEQNFIIEHRVWVNVANASKINVKINGIKTELSLNGRLYKNGLNVSDIKKYFLSIVPKYNVTLKYKDCWILMDRDHQADDNAEHLYRYINEYHPEQKIFFVLSNKSHDWERLYLEGFNLLDYGSSEHEEALQSCSKVISSHANYYVTNYLGRKMLANRHFVFLQHGITKDDLSSWLNNKDNIDCFITATSQEYESIINDKSKYNYNEKEVVLTGFPRHDKLVSSFNRTERLILIMPTWRQNAVGPIAGQGDERLVNPNFHESDFAQNWKALLHSERLQLLLKLYNFKVIFFPHSLIQPYLGYFDVPEYIEVMSHHHGSIQDLFCRASMMITDYSSVSFEMAVQKKMTLYYQFDEDEVFAGAHTYSKGYFDYRRDGFGPVTTDLDSLLDNLERIIENDAIPEPFILKRIKNTFPLLDGKSCERTFYAIKALDEPLADNHVNLKVVEQYSLEAFKSESWLLAEKRFKSYFSISEYVDGKYLIMLAKAMRMQGKFHNALSVLENIIESNEEILDGVYEELAYINMGLNKWEKAISLWTKIGKDTGDNIDYCFCIANIHEPVNIVSCSDEYTFLRNVLWKFSLRDWEGILALDSDPELLKSQLDIRQFEYVLIALATAYREKEEYSIGLSYALQLESIDSSSVHSKYEYIRLLFANKKYDDLIKKVYHWFSDISQLPIEIVYYYVSCLCFKNRREYANDLCNAISKELLSNDQDWIYYAELLFAIDKYDEVFPILKGLENYSSHTAYMSSYSSMKIGEFDYSFDVLEGYKGVYTSDMWKLRSEVAQLTNHWSDAYNSWLQYLHTIPSSRTMSDMDTLQKLRLISYTSI